MRTSLISLFAVVIINNLPSGDAIMCYVCNSGKMYDKEGYCPAINTQSEKIQADYKVNCTTLPPRDGLYEYVRCRTLVQDVDGDERIVRSCATWPDPHGKTNRCIDRTGTAKIKLRYCECDTDLCNAANTIGWSSLLATTVLILSALLCSHPHF